jgi:cell division protein FtsB
MPKNVDKFVHTHETVNIEGIFGNILTELQSLKSESEKQRKEIINLKHGDACQCLQKRHVVSLTKEIQKLAEEYQQLHERNNSLLISYV